MGINNNHLEPGIDVELTANLIVGSILRLSYFYFAQGEEKKPPADVDRIAEEVCRIFLWGIFPAKTSPNPFS